MSGSPEPVRPGTPEASADSERPGRHRVRRPRIAMAMGMISLLVAGAAVAGSAMAAAPPPPPPPPDPEVGPVADAAHGEALVPGTPCGVTTRACIDLESQRAWLITNGKVSRGPMKISTGASKFPTPVGHSYRVYRKDKDHKSGEFKTPDGKPSPMPFSVFFADGGVAFHGGDPSRQSAGCVRMEMPDAQFTFNFLNSGDKVQAVNASKELGARKRAAAKP